jgi:hypothetical protein
MPSLPEHAAGGPATPSPPAPAGGRRWPGLRQEVWPFLELLTLTGFAIAQPLFDVTGRSPEFFVFRRASTREILLLTLAVTLLPAVLLWALEVVAGLLEGERVRRVVHLAVVAALLLLVAVEALKQVSPLRGKRLLVLAAVVAGLTVLLYARRPAVRLWLRYLAPAPLVFALLFTTASPVSKLVLPQRASSAPAAQVTAKTPVVMIVFDEFPMMSLLDRKGKIDARVYPNFARLAAGSTWYRNATGVSGLTTNAVPAILTSQYPTKARVPLHSAYPNNLFTLLGRAYDHRVSESVTRLCPPALCAGSKAATKRPTSLPTLLKDTGSVWMKIVSPRTLQEDVTAQFAEATGGRGATGSDPAPKVLFGIVMNNKPVRFNDFLGGMQAPSPSAKPPFHFIHMMLPHPPWYYLPSGRTYSFPLDTFGLRAGKTWETNSWTTEQAPVLLAHQRHLLQLAYTDSLIGQMLDRLKAQGLYDESLVVVTADHGNTFTPGQPRRILTDRNASELMWVPLFIKAPHQRKGAVDDRNWEHVDLLPTVADLLHVRVPWPVDGMSQATAATRHRREKYFYNSPGARSVVDGPRNQALALQGVTDRVARPQEGPAGLFKVGPHADLVGRPLGQLRVAGSSGQTAKLDHPEAYGRVNLASANGVPAQVSGEIVARGQAKAPLTIVFAVNGIVGAAAQTFQERDAPMKFAAMVPDALFNQGENRLQLFTFDTAGPTPLLRPVALGGGA